MVLRHRCAPFDVQRRLDEHPEKMRQRRETVEHPFGTIKARMGATHFLMKTLKRVNTEIALHVLAYNLTRVMNIMGTGPLVAAMRHRSPTPQSICLRLNSARKPCGIARSSKSHQNQQNDQTEPRPSRSQVLCVSAKAFSHSQDPQLS
jgi:Transposase DDE domain